MDGANFTSVVTLGDVVEQAMRKRLPFGEFRALVYQCLKQQRCFFIGADRVGEGGSYIILVTYYDEENVTRVESFDEWPEYTNAQPISTW